MYYLSTQDKVYPASEIRRKVGLDPLITTNLDMLNRAGVYPVSNNDAQPSYDTRLYTTTVSYVVTGQYGVKTFTATDKPLNEARDAAYVGLKQKYEAQMSAAVGDWGILTLVAIAAKTSSPKTDEETNVISEIKIISSNLASDIDAVQSAGDVATIDSILNS